MTRTSRSSWSIVSRRTSAPVLVRWAPRRSWDGGFQGSEQKPTENHWLWNQPESPDEWFSLANGSWLVNGSWLIIHDWFFVHDWFTWCKLQPDGWTSVIGTWVHLSIASHWAFGWREPCHGGHVARHVRRWCSTWCHLSCCMAQIIGAPVELNVGSRAEISRIIWLRFEPGE